MPALAIYNDAEDAIIASLLFVGLYVAALWVTAIVWTFRDIRGRTDDTVEQAASVLLVTVFSVPGLLLYILMRPKQTLEEQLDRRLEAEAMYHEIEQHPMCPRCASVIQRDFAFCPVCRAELRMPCRQCGRSLAIDWVACPYCAEDAGPRVAAAAASRANGHVAQPASRPLGVPARQRA